MLAPLLVAVMYWTGPSLLENASGLVPFDTHDGGYNLDDAQTYLLAINEDGRALYLGAQRWVDTVFLVVFTLVIAICIFLSTPNWPRLIRFPLVVAPFVYGLCDLMENALVAGLLRTNPDSLTAESVAYASRWTVWKFLAVDIALLALSLVLVVRALASGWRRISH